jgi:hypothetical protein
LKYHLNVYLIQAISFLRDVFDKEVPLSKIANDKFPNKFIPKNIRKYLYILKGNETNTKPSDAAQTSPTSNQMAGTVVTTTPTVVTTATKPTSTAATISNAYHLDKYEFYLYQSIVKEIDKGNIFCNESTKYKSLSADIVSDKVWRNKDKLIQKLNYPNIAVDIEQRLDELETKLHAKTLEVNRKIVSKENSHIKIKESKIKDGNKNYNMLDILLPYPLLVIVEILSYS